jgi:anti-sigma regulatory factor (Ser/Thr protein kinase)
MVPPEAATTATIDAPPALSLELASKRDSPARARRALTTLERSVDHRVLAKARLLVTELVANSVHHAPGRPILVEVALADGTLRAEVSDGGSGFEPPTPDPRPLKRTGWGLLLVRRMADRWGVGDGDVWFELDLPGHAGRSR